MGRTRGIVALGPARPGATRRAVEAIYQTGYFTNHGPAAREAEARLQEVFGAGEAVIVSNATLCLMICLVGMEVKGTVLVPGFAPPQVAEAVLLSGLRPVFCDVDPRTGQLDLADARGRVRNDTRAVIPVDMWGDLVPDTLIEAFAAEHELRVVYYASLTVGPWIRREPSVARRQASVFSFDGMSPVQAQGAACVITPDPEFASIVRNMRSSYGSGVPRTVPVTVNGRVSELHASLIGSALEGLSSRAAARSELSATVVEALENTGMTVGPGAADGWCPHVPVIVQGEDPARAREEISVAMRRGGVDWLPGFPALHRVDALGGSHASGDLPAADRLAERVGLLPLSPETAAAARAILGSR